MTTRAYLVLIFGLALASLQTLYAATHAEGSAAAVERAHVTLGYIGFLVGATLLSIYLLARWSGQSKLQRIVWGSLAGIHMQVILFSTFRPSFSLLWSALPSSLGIMLAFFVAIGYLSHKGLSVLGQEPVASS